MATVSPPTDWQTGKTLSESFDHIFTSGIASDVTFLVGEEKTKICAHKLVLISRSPVFYAMLEGPMAEKGEIIIPHISEETFRLFLRYLYTDVIDLTARNVVPVLNAARKYCVDILVSLCENFLTKNLTVDNACVLLEQAHIFMIDSLKEKCQQLIDGNPSAALRSVTFTDLCLTCVTRITGNNDLRATENDVYEAVIKWAEAECTRQNVEATAQNKREVLGETIYNVRYLHVDEKYFLGKMCSDMILKPEDVVEVVNYNRNQKTLVSEKLNTKKRRGIMQRIHRNGPVENGQWSTNPGNEAISFKSSVNMQLHGFGSFHTCFEPSCVNLKVFEENVCLVEATKMVAPSQPGTPYMGDVVLDNPIKIQAGKTYTILEQSHNRSCHYFNTANTKVAIPHGTIEFSNSLKSDNTNISKGQIPYILLNT